MFNSAREMTNGRSDTKGSTEMPDIATHPGAPVVPSAPGSSASTPHIPPTPVGELPFRPSVTYLPTRLDSLPREILQQVLSELSWRDVVSCTRVGRCLNDACDSSLLWRRLCLDEYTSWHKDHLIEERLGLKGTVVITAGGAGDGLFGDVLGTGQQQQGTGRERLGRENQDGEGHAETDRERKTSTVLDTDWKLLFVERKLQDKRFASAFDRVLSRQDGRIDVITQITGRGEDARDLMERYRLAETTGGINDDNDDSLARTYWANEILGSINRAQALREVTHVLTAASRRRWRSAGRDRQQQQDYPLIKVLWAIDYFVAESPPETLPQMLTHLDNIAAGFRAEYPGCFPSSPSSPGGQESRRTSHRQRALSLAEFVRAHDLVGVRSPETYHDLQNSLVSVALCERDHPALPLISHAIYCALAERVGLAAGLTNTPRHVYVTVRAPEGATLDDDDEDGYDDGAPQKGRATSNSSTSASAGAQDEDELDPSRTMFLDPFHHKEEVPLSQLSNLYAGGGAGMNHAGGVGGLLGFASLIAAGQNAHHHHHLDHHPAGGGQLPTAQLAAALAPASTRDMMFRMANNLQETLRGSVHSLAYRTALVDPTDEFVGHLTGSSSSSSPSSSTAVDENHHLRPRRGGIRPTVLNPYRARYCAWWLQTLLDETAGGGVVGGLHHRALYNFVEDFMHHFKEADYPLVQDYMLTAFRGGFVVSSPGAGGGEDVLGAADEAGREEAAFVETVLAHVKREDARVRTAKRRDFTGARAADTADSTAPAPIAASSPDSQDTAQQQQPYPPRPRPCPRSRPQGSRNRNRSRSRSRSATASATFFGTSDTGTAR
ncbi:F-box protein 21 [Microdochium nivale]|nr:F-box protein 21 [Microdochium nivale]